MGSEFSSFLDTSYRIEKELGHNRAGGRVTYLATDTQTNCSVVIKQFQFAQSGSSWADFDSHQREVQLLKDLDHPGIPGYLESFQLENGFCLVQEYKHALPLAKSRSFSQAEIRQIAIAVLEILVYLQNRIPPIIHRDIKPENILIDTQGNVYLVDFGFAHVGEGEVGVSSVVKGTLGFMPPEQLFCRELTEASDLYGLGMTLICLLTGTQSDQIGNLVDISYRVSFKHLVPRINARWISWLEKMVESRLKDRFPNALAALAALPTAPLRLPEAQFSATRLEFQSRWLGEQLTQSVKITNPAAETVLEGRWEIVPHLHDPDAELYRWITVEPAEFVGDQITCQITVDTSKLMAGKTYHRTLQLQTNTLNQTYSVALQVQTALIPVQSQELPYRVLSLLWIFLVGLSWLASGIIAVVNNLTASSGAAGFGAIAGLAIGLEGSSWVMRSAGWRAGAKATTLVSGSLAFGILAWTLMGNIVAGSMAIAGALVGLGGGAIAALALGLGVEELVTQHCSKGSAIALSLLTATFATSLGISLAGGISHPLLYFLLTVSSLTLLTTVVRLKLKQTNALFSHRKTERYLIKP